MKKIKTDTLRTMTNLTEQMDALDDFTLLHTAWTPLGWTRKSLYKTGESAYFTTEKSRLFHDPEETGIRTLRRLEAIRLAIQMNASDEALEELGIELFEDGMVTEDFHIEHRGTQLVSIRLNLSIPNQEDIRYADALFQNCDGKFFKCNQLFVLPLRILWEHETVVSQRDAIAFALENRTTPNAMKIIGITGIAD